MRTKLDEIESARVKILKLQDEQDEIYTELDHALVENEWVWDYCFNCPDINSDYAIKCRQEIEAAINKNESGKIGDGYIWRFK